MARSVQARQGMAGGARSVKVCQGVERCGSYMAGKEVPNIKEVIR